ncbi:hypothetical protein RCL1_000775 [Eukaryota sp. TZLM3-RCL]
MSCPILLVLVLSTFTNAAFLVRNEHLPFDPHKLLSTTNNTAFFLSTSNNIYSVNFGGDFSHSLSLFKETDFDRLLTLRHLYEVNSPFHFNLTLSPILLFPLPLHSSLISASSNSLFCIVLDNNNVLVHDLYSFGTRNLTSRVISFLETFYSFNEIFISNIAVFDRHVSFSIKVNEIQLILNYNSDISYFHILYLNSIGFLYELSYCDDTKTLNWFTTTELFPISAISGNEINLFSYNINSKIITQSNLIDVKGTEILNLNFVCSNVAVLINYPSSPISSLLLFKNNNYCKLQIPQINSLLEIPKFITNYNYENPYILFKLDDDSVVVLSSVFHANNLKCFITSFDWVGNISGFLFSNIISIHQNQSFSLINFDRDFDGFPDDYDLFPLTPYAALDSDHDGIPDRIDFIHNTVFSDYQILYSIWFVLVVVCFTIFHHPKFKIFNYLKSQFNSDYEDPSYFSALTPFLLLWQLIILILTVISVYSLLAPFYFGHSLPIREVAYLAWVDFFVCSVFWFDLITRFRFALNSEKFTIIYFFLQTWYEIPALIPEIPGFFSFGSLRILRLLRFVLILRLIKLVRVLKLVMTLRKNKFLKNIFLVSPVFYAFLLLSALICFASVILKSAEQHVNPDFQDFWNVVWFSLVSVSTVGYGDLAPKTSVGRLTSTLLMIFGVSTISTLSAQFLRKALEKSHSYRKSLESSKIRTVKQSYLNSALRRLAKDLNPLNVLPKSQHFDLPPEDQHPTFTLPNCDDVHSLLDGSHDTSLGFDRVIESSRFVERVLAEAEAMNLDSEGNAKLWLILRFWQNQSNSLNLIDSKSIFLALSQVIFEPPAPNELFIERLFFKGKTSAALYSDPIINRVTRIQNILTKFHVHQLLPLHAGLLYDDLVHLLYLAERTFVAKYAVNNLELKSSSSVTVE